ncbi:MAG: hypothetical protein D6719_13135 [Candidatus Dadabacteria bacterium]|nr:MAG: hypothetical protein D6719_13135 [Candidatus Dadabacteria bacterium]
MNKYILSPIYLLIALWFAYLLCAPLLDPYLTYPLKPVDGSIYTIASATHNAYHLWRDGPILRLIGEVLQQLLAQPSKAYLLAEVFILFVSVYIFLFFKLPTDRRLLAAPGTLLLTCAVIILFGSDRVVLASISWFALLSVILDKLLNSQHSALLWKLLVVLAAPVSALATGPLALLLYILALLIALYSKEHSSPINTTVKLVLLTSGAIMFYTGIVFPAPHIPDYPFLAHVVPDDGLPGIITPLISSAPSIPFINRAGLKSIYFAPSLLLTLVALILLIILYNSNKATRDTLVILCLLAGNSLLDSLPAESIASIMPVAVIGRLLPGLFFIPLLPIFFSLAIIYFAELSLRSHIAVATVLPVFIAVLLATKAGEQPAAILQKQAPHSIYAASGAEERKIIASPSLNVILNEGIWAIKHRKRILSFRHLLKRRKIIRVYSSHHNNRKVLKKMFDSNPATRWSTALGRQIGGEWLHIYFKEPLKVGALKLDPGIYLADFPRGITVKTGDKCFHGRTKQMDRFKSYKTVYSQPNWQGPVQVTPEGYPYYGGQSDVTLYFSEPLTTSCLLVVQTGKHPKFEWSVAELQVELAQKRKRNRNRQQRPKRQSKIRRPPAS